MTIRDDGSLHVPVVEVNKPCEECGSTKYPNLEYDLPLVNKGVLCRPCLNKVVGEVNQALQQSNKPKSPEQ